MMFNFQVNNLAEILFYDPIKNISKANTGFSFAEVFVTLIIAGIVAAMVIPALVNDFREAQTKVALKETFAVLNQALKRAQLDNFNVPIKCYYWSKMPYGKDICANYDGTGECTLNTYPDGNALPSNYHGYFTECGLVLPVMKNYMNVIKTCAAGTAISDGCLWAYKGNDQVSLDKNPAYTPYDMTKATTGCGNYRTSKYALKEALVLNNGVTIFPYGTTFASSHALIGVDINGKRPPNKAGYDLFFFEITGMTGSDLKFIPGGCEYTEVGGKSTSAYLYSAT